MKLQRTHFMSQLPTAIDHTTAMADYVDLGDDLVLETDTVMLRRVDAGVAALVAAQKAEEKRRKLTLILTGAGVLFAAVKLGFIAVPHILARRKS